MRYSDESKADFVNRIKKAKGVGTVSCIRPIARGDAAMAWEGKREESLSLLIDMTVRCHARFESLERFGPASKWGYDCEADMRSRAEARRGKAA